MVLYDRKTDPWLYQEEGFFFKDKLLEILFECNIMRKVKQRRVEIVTIPVHGVESFARS